MRKKSVFVALLVSGCFSDPAYIGEGPATDTGGNGGASGSGTSGMGSGVSGTAGTASGGTGTAGSVGSGVPVQGGNGSAPGAGSRLPLESGSCRIHERMLDETAVVTWDAETRTLTKEGLDYRFDENARVVDVWYEGQEFGESIEYDAMGTVTSVVYMSHGVELASSSWDQRNEYESESGRLNGSFINYHDGSMEHIDYSDNDGPPAAMLRTIISDVATTTIRYAFRYEQGRPTFFQATTDDRATERRTATYDAMGRLLQTDWDDGWIGNGLDGSVENREKWFYDDAGRIIRHEVDFESGEPWPAPLDGIADRVYEIEPECAAIAVLPYAVYGIPSWLFPYHSTVGWIL